MQSDEVRVNQPQHMEILALFIIIKPKHDVQHLTNHLTSSPSIQFHNASCYRDYSI
jgi:hypothetical protein